MTQEEIPFGAPPTQLAVHAPEAQESDAPPDQGGEGAKHPQALQIHAAATTLVECENCGATNSYENFKAYGCGVCGRRGGVA